MKKIILIIILLLAFCKTNKSEPVEPIALTIPKVLPISLSFSDTHVHYYANVDVTSYALSEADSLFSDMKDKSDIVCEMVWGRKRYNKEVVYEFLNKDIFGIKPFDRWGHPLPKLVAGCWNFFKMNDESPDRDMNMVLKHFSSQKKDCYSVGFLQPYIMGNLLNCERITVVDIDWRIHYGHWQILNLFNKQVLQDELSLDQGLSKMDIGWVAFEKNFQKKIPSSLSSFCRRDEFNLCKSQLLQFQRRMNDVKSFRLMVSSLHDADYSKLEGTMKVIYFSNALERTYTSRSEFNVLMTKLASDLNPNETAALIYHTGGHPNFGLYTLQKTEDQYLINTICKDQYFAGIDKHFYKYRTYLDEQTQSKGKIPTCKDSF